MNSTEDYKKLSKSYKDANLILVTSIEAKKFIKDIFPSSKNKILTLNQSINFSKKKYIKKNYITCMPRKLPAHFHLLKFFIKDKLPKNWKIDVLENISESQLEYKMNRSKFFLSFSHLEGFGIPPLEAALAKNKVIGYVGGGGHEYWKKPIFQEIKYGDIDSFGNTLLREIKNYSKSWIENTKKERTYLSKRYSVVEQEKFISRLAKIILKFY
jgi:glycosyltransferase involved in cell wall biosynthesis